MIDMNLSIQDLVNNMQRQKHHIKELNFDSLSENDIEIINDYNYEQRLFTEVGNALDFATAATPIVIEHDGAIIESLMERAECLSALRTLSNNFDNNFVNLVYTEYSGEADDVQYARADLIAHKLDLLCASTEFAAMIEAENFPENITINDLKVISLNMESLMREYQIDQFAITEDTLLLVADKHSRPGELYKLTEVASQSIENGKDKDNLVVVESNDGYVMATNASPELFRVNPETERQYFEQVRNGNEIVHNEAPRQTTIDTVKVGGNIKYEQYYDYGTIEREKSVQVDKFSEDREEKGYHQLNTDGSDVTNKSANKQHHDDMER